MNSSDDRTRRCAWRIVVAIFVIATAMNHVWEVAQASLYAGMGDVTRMVWYCIAPSLGDGALALLIFFIGWPRCARLD